MIYELVLRILIVVFSLFFSAVTSAFQLSTRKLCLQFSGLRMRNFTRNRFPIKNLLIDSLLTPIVESKYLNRDMCKFESSQKDESRWQSTDSSKAYRNTSALKLLLCNSENSDIAWWNKNNSEWGFSVFFEKRTKSFFFLKNQKNVFLKKNKKQVEWVFWKKTGLSQPWL